MRNLIFILIITLISSMVPYSPRIYAENSDINLLTTRDSFIIFASMLYYSSSLKWPKDKDELRQYYDQPKGNFNAALINNATLSINDNNNLEIKIGSESSYRKIELRKVENGDIKYKAKYFESNDPNLKDYLPFELNFTAPEYSKFYGEIKE